MKTARRQELRTNELSQQLEDISSYVKENFAKLAIVVVVSAAAVGGIYWFFQSRQTRYMEDWRALEAGAEPGLSAQTRIEQFEKIAQERRSDGLSAAAWLKIGNTALKEVLATPEGAVANAGLLERAAVAFDNVIKQFPDNLSAVGNAMMGRALVEESRVTPDLAKARDYYQKVKEDKRLSLTPLPAEAAYRLERLEKWAGPIQFPEPPPPPQPVVGPALPSAQNQPMSLTAPASSLPPSASTPQVEIQQITPEERDRLEEEAKQAMQADQSSPADQPADNADAAGKADSSGAEPAAGDNAGNAGATPNGASE